MREFAVIPSGKQYSVEERWYGMAFLSVFFGSYEECIKYAEENGKLIYSQR